MILEKPETSNIIANEFVLVRYLLMRHCTYVYKKGYCSIIIPTIKIKLNDTDFTK